MKSWNILALTLALTHQAVCFVAFSSSRVALTSFQKAVPKGKGPVPRASRTAPATSVRAGLRMGIFEDISAQMKHCMKSGEKDKLSGLRIIRAAFLTETKTAGSGDSLPDEKCLTILRKLSKMQQESIDMYRQGGREELVQKEQMVQDLIESFLPKLADEDTTQKWADEAIEKVGAKGPSDMGKVMGLLMKEHKAEMDGKLAQKLVTARLKGS